MTSRKRLQFPNARCEGHSIGKVLPHDVRKLPNRDGLLLNDGSGVRAVHLDGRSNPAILGHVDTSVPLEFLRRPVS